MAGARHAVGFDFGTSTTLVSDRRGDSPATIVPIGRATSFMPSVAGRNGKTALIVGEDADILPVGDVVRSVKRAITEGRETVIPQGGSAEFRVSEVVLAILHEARSRAAAAGTKLIATTPLRMGCPAMWSGHERRLLQELAAEAGLPLGPADLVDEPIAAGISWVWNRYLRRGDRADGNVLVFDYGGGTLDIAVLEVYFETEPEITVLSALGVGQAGDALDNLVFQDLLGEWAAAGAPLDGLDRPEVAKALALRAARDAKVALSNHRDAKVRLGRPYERVPAIAYSREQLETVFSPQLENALGLCWAAIRAARLRQSHRWTREELLAVNTADLAKDIRYVLLAGGLSQVPMVQRRLQELFPHAEVESDQSLGSPTESVAAGLAFTTEYDRLNLHRPGFDMVLEWDAPGGGGVLEHCLYPAHTPLYEPYQVLTGQSNLGFSATSGSSDPVGGRGRLKVKSVDGAEMPLRVDGRTVNQLPLRFSRQQPLRMKLYVDGRLVIRSIDSDVVLRVEQWPVVRGSKPQPLVLHTITAPSSDYREPGWWHERV